MELTELNPIEKQRIYVYPDGTTAVFYNVTHFAASKTTHRLRTDNGNLHIVAEGWRYITLVDHERFTL